MALRRLPVLVSLALTIACCSTSPVGASPSSRGYGSITRTRADGAFNAHSATVTPADIGGIVASSLCWERDYTDPAGDAPIDAIAYRLTYDCQSATWTLSVTLAAPLDPAAFDSFASEIDTDNNPNNGCEGFDFLVAGVFDTNGNPKGVLVSTPACDSSSWTTVSKAGFSVNGTALALTYSEHALGDAPQLVWNAGVVPMSSSAAVDALPDAGILVSDHFLQETAAHDGYWLTDAAGGVHAYGNAPFHGDLAGAPIAQPIVGLASTGRSGYWLLGRDGGVFSFGNAAFHGSTGGRHLNQPVVAMAAPTTGHGYWFVAADGGIFSFGGAAFHGSTGAIHLNEPIVGMASTPTGKGYWLVASDGGIFSFGDAAFYGSTGAIHLVSPIVGMKVTPTGLGYRFVAADGGIFSFGDANFLGGLGGGKPPSPVVGIA
jgi:hypothetical protein